MIMVSDGGGIRPAMPAFLHLYTLTVMSVFKGSGREIPSAVMSRLPSMMQAGAVEGGN